MNNAIHVHVESLVWLIYGPSPELTDAARQGGFIFFGGAFQTVAGFESWTIGTYLYLSEPPACIEDKNAFRIGAEERALCTVLRIGLG